MPYQPAAETRNPVMTSSLISSAPCSAVIRRSASVNPGSGGTTPMFPAAASVIDAGDAVPVLRERGLDGADVVVRQDDRVRGGGTGDAGCVGQREGRDAAAGGGEQRVDVAVVVTGELHDGAAGR